MSTTTKNSFSESLFFWGHLAKGVVYLLIGGLALATVFTNGGSTSGPREVIDFIREQAFGQALAVVMAIGMICYCLWRWTKALQDKDNEGDDAKGMAKRSAYAASGSFYGLLGATILLSAFGNGSAGSGSQEDVLSQLLNQSWGPFLVGIFGIVMVVTALYQLKRGWREEFMADIRTGELDEQQRRLYKNFGKAGHLARSVVYGVIAYFLFQVALSEDADQFRGISGALEYINRGFGTWLFAIVSLGLLLYGTFMFVKARYRPSLSI